MRPAVGEQEYISCGRIAAEPIFVRALPKLRPESRMTSSVCAECGATYPLSTGECGSRFDELLALDHSRVEPWGSRHGQAFAAFALSHPVSYARSLDRAWSALYAIYALGAAPHEVFAQLRAVGAPLAVGPIPQRPVSRVALPHVTIAGLPDFPAVHYAAWLDGWCRAVLASWGARVPAAL
jgi:Family of unknown function (DUF5946)